MVWYGMVWYVPRRSIVNDRECGIPTHEKTSRHKQILKNGHNQINLHTTTHDCSNATKKGGRYSEEEGRGEEEGVKG